MDERREREGVTKGCKNAVGETPFHFFLLADGEKQSSIVTSLAIVGTRYRYSHSREHMDLTTGGVSVVIQVARFWPQP